MTLYRSALALFVAGNVALFTYFMWTTSLPWNLGLVFLGYIYANGPIVVSIFTAEKIDKTLAGHWLNWLNIFLPLAVGTAGFYVYGFLALQPDSDAAAIFTFGTLLITAAWSVLFGVLVNIYVFVSDR